MDFLKRNAKAVMTFVSTATLQALWPYAIAAAVGDLIGLWGIAVTVGMIIVAGLIAGRITWWVPNG